jgi:hypothetical protein
VPRKRRGNRASEVYHCQNPACGRLLLISGYTVAQVRKDAPAEKIHRVRDPIMAPGVTLLCSCGHYTVVESH